MSRCASSCLKSVAPQQQTTRAVMYRYGLHRQYDEEFTFPRHDSAPGALRRQYELRASMLHLWTGGERSGVRLLAGVRG